MAPKRIRDLDDGSGLVASTDSIPVDRAGLDEAERVTLQQAIDATDVAGAYVPGGTDVPVADGGTGSSTAAGARTNLGAEEAGAAAAAQAAAVQRANHTGTQAASTISDFASAVAATAAVTANTAKVTNATHTGDVTGATALTIANDAVTNAKLANVATSTIKGRATAGTGDPEDLTVTQVRTLLDISAFGATLVDDADAATARTTLGLGTIATQAANSVSITGGSISGITDLALADGGTGASTAAAAKSNLSPLNTVAASGATETLVMGVNDVTMDESCTFTFPTVGAGHHEFTLILRGAFTPTFPASVDWPSGAAPTYASPTEFSFATVDSGTTWLGVGAPGLA